MNGRPDEPANQLPGLPAGAFRSADPSPDAAFYVQPRFVTHIDDGAIAAVTNPAAAVQRHKQPTSDHASTRACCASSTSRVNQAKLASQV